MINEVACYLYAYHAPWLATGSAKGTAVNEIFHQDNISSHEMYALETYKLAQDADKVWNGKKWKAAHRTTNFKFKRILVGTDGLAVSDHKSEGEDANTIWRQEYVSVITNATEAG